MHRTGTAVARPYKKTTVKIAHHLHPARPILQNADTQNKQTSADTSRDTADSKR